MQEVSVPGDLWEAAAPAGGLGVCGEQSTLALHVCRNG